MQPIHFFSFQILFVEQTTVFIYFNICLIFVCPQTNIELKLKKQDIMNKVFKCV